MAERPAKATTITTRNNFRNILRRSCRAWCQLEILRKFTDRPNRHEARLTKLRIRHNGEILLKIQIAGFAPNRSPIPFSHLNREHDNFFACECMSLTDRPDVHLTCTQCNQSLVTVSGDGDNSLSSRWVKFGSRASMIHAAGAGGG